MTPTPPICTTLSKPKVDKNLKQIYREDVNKIHPKWHVFNQRQDCFRVSTTWNHRRLREVVSSNLVPRVSLPTGEKKFLVSSHLGRETLGTRLRDDQHSGELQLKRKCCIRKWIDFQVSSDKDCTL